MQTGARALTDSIQATDATLSVEVYGDTAAEVVGSRSHGDVVFGDVDADGKALFVDIREVRLGLLGVFVGDIDMFVKIIYLEVGD